MKIRLLSLALVLALVVALFGGASQVKATGYGTAFVTSITFQNVGTGPANLTITFYPASGGTPVTWSPSEGALPVNAGSSLYVGGVSGVGQGFQGSAVMSSDQPLVSVLVQVPQAPSTVKNRPLSSGLPAGSSNVLIPTVLKGVFDTNTIFAIQNTDTDAADLTVNFIPVSGTPTVLNVANLGPGMAKYYDMGKEAGIPAGFNGSVTIAAVKTGTTTPGSVVATSMELHLINDNVYAFEGTSEAGDTLYMPSAFCRFRGGLINSAYAVQNTDPTLNASVTVRYSNGNTEGPFVIAPGAKKSLQGCGDTGTVNPAGFIGSAVITSTGGKIVGIGKIFGDGISSAFNGMTSGAARIALPYVRWTESQWFAGTRQRGNIAIQNVGTANLAAGAVTVKYYDKDGNLACSHSLPAIAVGAKANSNPMACTPQQPEFGAPAPGTTAFGGGAIVEGPAGSQLAVLVRIETFNVAAGSGSLGEDYNGVPIP